MSCHVTRSIQSEDVTGRGEGSKAGTKNGGQRQVLEATGPCDIHTHLLLIPASDPSLQPKRDGLNEQIVDRTVGTFPTVPERSDSAP